MKKIMKLFLALSITLTFCSASLSFAKSVVAGYPYVEVDRFFPLFSPATQKMVGERGGDLFKEFNVNHLNRDFVYAAVKIYMNGKKLDEKEQKLFSKIDFNNDFEKDGGFVLSKFAFMMPKKHATFYSIDEQMSKENLNNLLNNIVIENINVQEGKINLKRLLNIDVPVFGGEKVIPLVGATMFFDGHNYQGNNFFRKFTNGIRKLDKNLAEYPYDEMYVAARGVNNDDLIRGVNAYITYYHISNEYDLVVGYELGRMSKIPSIPFVTGKILDRLENRNRMEIANLIYKFTK